MHAIKLTHKKGTEKETETNIHTACL